MPFEVPRLAGVETSLPGTVLISSSLLLCWGRVGAPYAVFLHLVTDMQAITDGISDVDSQVCAATRGSTGGKGVRGNPAREALQ